jgi:hypothetical protein
MCQCSEGSGDVAIEKGAEAETVIWQIRGSLTKGHLDFSVHRVNPNPQSDEMLQRVVKHLEENGSFEFNGDDQLRRPQGAEERETVIWQVSAPTPKRLSSLPELVTCQICGGVFQN